MANMLVKIRYFAALRETTGRGDDTLELPDGATVAEARERLTATQPALARLLPVCAVAVNRAYVAADHALTDGDELVFIPPLGGG